MLPAVGPEAGLHSPNGQERPGRDAVALLNGREHCRMGLLERAPARDDGRAATLGEKLIERQTEAPLATVGRDGGSRIVRRHEGCDGGGTDTLCPRFIGELALPRFEAGRGVATLRGARVAGLPSHDARRLCRDEPSSPALAVSKYPPIMTKVAAVPGRVHHEGLIGL